ncbi:MAG TPA: TlpA family protein disulfide reductase [Bryobacteraceae bacterium]|nr:TlpA family protein disulfide reductase [Bryobacteraceae bacterium]
MRLKLIPVFLIAAMGYAGIVDDARAVAAQNNLALGDALVARYRAQFGVTPEFLEALSWLGRGALAARQLDKAESYARQTETLAVEQLKKRPLDAEPHLPLALGAAIEVQGLALNARGERGEAIQYLEKELATYRATSIRTRIQKNINTLGLEGKPAPALEEREFLGSKPVPLPALRGKPVLLFFWAHWCPDCKQEAPILAQIRQEYAGKGLVIIAPTQRYGYVARGEEAGPAEELKYIDEVRKKFYADLLSVPAPVSEENFKNYGASTTPTLVILDRRGIVRVYHPGVMTLDELRAALNRIG